MNYIYLFIITLLIIVVLVYLVYYLIYRFNNSVVLIPKITEACCQFTYPCDKFKYNWINKGMEFTFSLWFYLASWEYKYNTEKIILFWKGKNIKNNYIVINNSDDCIAKLNKCAKQNTDKYGGLKIYLSQEKNNLIVEYTLMNGCIESIEIPNIPIQKWINIVVLLKLRNLDVFINGKLEANRFLHNVPLYGKHKLIVNPKKGFDGFISKLVYYDQALKYPTIKEIFQKGP